MIIFFGCCGASEACLAIAEVEKAAVERDVSGDRARSEARAALAEVEARSIIVRLMIVKEGDAMRSMKPAMGNGSLGQYFENY